MFLHPNNIQYKAQDKTCALLFHFVNSSSPLHQACRNGNLEIAKILIENGANIKDVQERLGHSNIETTMNTYVHNTDSMKKESVYIFEKAINQ